MNYITFTRVDAIDPSIVAPAPLPGGPVDPVGCVFGFALESQYPTNRPIFYGTTNGATDLPGILSRITKAEYDAAEAAETEARDRIAHPPEIFAAISDRQFFQALASAPYNMITPQEALDAVKTGEIPAVMQAVIDQMPVAQQFPATMLVAGATNFERDNPLVAVFAASQNMTSAQVDALWRFAEGL